MDGNCKCKDERGDKKKVKTPHVSSNKHYMLVKPVSDPIVVNQPIRR